MKKTLIGVVAKSGQSKTLRVEIDRRMKHPKYGKIIRGRTVCHVHDESGVARKGASGIHGHAGFLPSPTHPMTGQTGNAARRVAGNA